MQSHLEEASAPGELFGPSPHVQRVRPIRGDDIMSKYVSAQGNPSSSTPANHLRSRVKSAVSLASHPIMGMPSFSATVEAAMVMGLVEGPRNTCTLSTAASFS